MAEIPGSAIAALATAAGTSEGVPATCVMCSSLAARSTRQMKFRKKVPPSKFEPSTDGGYTMHRTFSTVYCPSLTLSSMTTRVSVGFPSAE